jgi:hypothetical protein
LSGMGEARCAPALPPTMPNKAAMPMAKNIERISLSSEGARR